MLEAVVPMNDEASVGRYMEYNSGWGRPGWAVDWGGSMELDLLIVGIYYLLHSSPSFHYCQSG
jgi:hypothetical protein